nr:aldehyde ferredoxin oxidoreductase C-terminal domain-containing protein [Methanosarcina horonobensis]
MKLFEANPVLSKGLAKYGTPAFVKLLDYMDLIPCRNFSVRGTPFADMFSGEYIKSSLELEKESCPACPLGCKRRIRKTGQILPDYDSLWAFGFNLEIRILTRCSWQTGYVKITDLTLSLQVPYSVLLQNSSQRKSKQRELKPCLKK